MGMFDGPIFFDERLDVVSIWVSKCPSRDVPKEYFEENYDDDADDQPFNKFSDDFGFGFYDHDFVETAGIHGQSVEEKLTHASYGKSFAREASKACDVTGDVEFFLMYNFKYNPKVTKVTDSEYYKFIGCFPFDKNA
jgi:hypothetical protein